jgi:hypothetical protein
VYNLNTDVEARAEFLRRGFLLPPVVVINGEAIERFDPDRIEALIEQAELEDLEDAGASAEDA